MYRTSTAFLFRNVLFEMKCSNKVFACYWMHSHHETKGFKIVDNWESRQVPTHKESALNFVFLLNDSYEQIEMECRIFYENEKKRIIRTKQEIIITMTHTMHLNSDLYFMLILLMSFSFAFRFIQK